MMWRARVRGAISLFGSCVFLSLLECRIVHGESSVGG
jgi:hypothetical protein